MLRPSDDKYGDVDRMAGRCPGRPWRIVIVKWDRLWADMLKRRVEEIFPDAEILLCRSALETQRTLREGRADFGIFGLTLPDMDGLDLLRAVLEARTVARILVVSGRSDERVQQVLGEIKLDGYVDSTTCEEEFFRRVLCRLRDGGTYFSPFVRVNAYGGKTAEPRLEKILSRAELEVFAVIGDGSDDFQAAETLELSARTVHCHRQRIMSKLGVRTRAELMRAAIQRGVVRITADRVIRPGFERVLAERRSRVRCAPTLDQVRVATVA